jgi:hypothetical protein
MRQPRGHGAALSSRQRMGILACAFAHPSVTGRSRSTPNRASTRRVLASVRGRLKSERDKVATRWDSKRTGRPIYENVVSAPLSGHRPDLIHRPGKGTSLREAWCRDPPEYLDLSSYAAAPAVRLNGVRSINMRCMITASLRASATLAFFMPTRLASRSAQVLSAELFTGFESMMCAA